MAYIYVIYNDVNNKVYIGATTREIEDRWSEHLKTKNRQRTRNFPIYKAMNKYGEDKFHIKALEQCDDKYMNEREIYWINKYNSFHNGYNGTLGGKGKKIIEYNKILALWKSNKSLLEISRLTKHDKSWISKVLRMFDISSKSIMQRSLSNGNALSVIMMDKDNNEIKKFSSIMEAERYLGKPKINTHISEVCRNLRKTCCGYKWKYA